MNILVTEDEALILFEWLARLEESNSFPCSDPAEELVLLRLLAQLEKSLVQPLEPDYSDQLDAARLRVRMTGQGEE